MRASWDSLWYASYAAQASGPGSHAAPERQRDRRRAGRARRVPGRLRERAADGGGTGLLPAADRLPARLDVPGGRVPGQIRRARARRRLLAERRTFSSRACFCRLGLAGLAGYLALLGPLRGAALETVAPGSTTCSTSACGSPGRSASTRPSGPWCCCSTSCSTTRVQVVGRRPPVAGGALQGPGGRESASWTASPRDVRLVRGHGAAVAAVARGVRRGRPRSPHRVRRRHPGGLPARPVRGSAASPSVASSTRARRGSAPRSTCSCHDARSPRARPRALRPGSAAAQEDPEGIGARLLAEPPVRAALEAIRRHEPLLLEEQVHLSRSPRPPSRRPGAARR